MMDMLVDFLHKMNQDPNLGHTRQPDNSNSSNAQPEERPRISIDTTARLLQPTFTRRVDTPVQQERPLE